MKIEDIHLYQYSIPFKTPLFFKNSLHQNRNGLIIQITDEHNQYYYAEASPLKGFSPESLTRTIKEARRLKKLLKGTFWSLEILNSEHILQSAHTSYPSLYFALESLIYCALHSNEIQKPHALPINALLSGTRSEILEKIDLIQNIPTVKLKPPSSDVEETIDLVKEVRLKLPKDTKLRIDINRKWTLVEAIHFAGNFEKDAFEYIEEPLKDPHDLLSFSHLSDHKLAFDESIFDCPLDYLMQISTKAALVLKPALIGNLSYLKKLIKTCNEFAIKPVISCLFESGVGIRNLAYLTSLWNLEGPFGFDTYTFFKKDILETPFKLAEGYLHLPENAYLIPCTRDELKPV